MQFGGTPLFLWIEGQMVNMSLCQGVCYYQDEEDGWVVSFNMVDEFIFSQHDSEEEAKSALLAVFEVMQARGCVIGVRQAKPSESEEGEEEVEEATEGEETTPAEAAPTEEEPR